jgi:hypothetical protein
MKIRTIKCVCAVAVMALLPVVAPALVINVDIDARTSDSSASRQGIPYSGQGAYADVGNDYWNSLSTASRSVTGLVASDGSSNTAVNISIAAGDGYVHTGITNALLADYFYGTTTTTVSGLGPNADYTVYVYAVGDQSGQGSTVTIGSDVQTTSGDNTGVFSLGGNYVVFTAMADVSGGMTIVSSDKINGFQLVGDAAVTEPEEEPESTTVLVHPGMSHKQSDLERMKYQVAAQVSPWYSSYVEMCEDSKASYTYTVQGSTNLTEVYRDSPYTNKSKWESDSRAAYYNAIRWVVEGDSRYAEKAVEIFNAWTGLTYVQHSGTKTLTGSMVYIMLEAAEIIKCTYPGWSSAERQTFGDMLVYPGWSGTSVPDKLDLAYEDGGEGTWYWRVYEGDHRRGGNQELSGWRACMAIGIFLDNEVIYDRACRYIAGLDHRPDDLAYQPGPTYTTSEITTTPYNIAYNSTQYSSIEDYGYDGVLTNYVLETGQCGEAARDQGHCSWGLSCLESIAGMAWTQGDDLWGLEDNRLLKGLEYHTRYNLSYLQSYSDQAATWEPTVESGDFVQTLNRCARTKCLQINPYMEYDYTRVSRGAVTEDQWELAVGHYVGRGFASRTNEAKWITRTRDYNIGQSGYEDTDSGGAQIGWGGLTFRRPDYCYGDPISGFDSNNIPEYAVHVLPGTLEAELYDYATVNGEGRTFHDASTGNSGGEFRSDGDVDIGVCSEGGYALTDLEDGEWVSYTVYVSEGGLHSLKVRYAGTAGGAVRFAFEGTDVTGDVVLPSTGGATSWTTHTVAENISLNQGVQSLRLYVSGSAGAYALSSVTVTQEGEGVGETETRIQAEDCVGQSGLNLSDACSDDGGGYNVGGISDGDWAEYGSYALGKNASIRFRIARPSGRAEGRIEIRLDSKSGTLIGSQDLVVTGGWQEWETFETKLDPVDGSHPLYLVFVENEASTLGGDMCNLNWFELVIPDDPAAPTGLSADAVNASQVDLEWNAATGASGYNLKRGTTSGGPYEIISVGPTSSKYTDSGLLAETHYYYVVSTVSDGVESTNSLEVSAVPAAEMDPADVIMDASVVLENGAGGKSFSITLPVSGLGYTYHVLASEDLIDPDWQSVSESFLGNGGELQMMVPIEANQMKCYYKLEVLRE